MKDLKKIVSEASEKELTRKQFLGVVGAGLVGAVSAFGVMQELSTPDLANRDTGAFGELEYGHSGKPKEDKPKKKGLFG